jgi:hypothetical protein
VERPQKPGTWVMPHGIAYGGEVVWKFFFVDGFLVVVSPYFNVLSFRVPLLKIKALEFPPINSMPKNTEK